ncbi:uncharacterized protein LOC124163231 [Ischnura elegans]|uniref:uncharacterized protein LOC124163231 n=1 Tax=Ischnura elegans TaxID=197161 RepID=UPI001ED8A2E2|nr:uncharacterized protein LOC124163231 [Ischnura elegans]
MIQDGTPACIEWPIHIVIEKTPKIDTYREAKEYEKCIGKLGQGRNLLKGYEARRQALLNKKWVVYPNKKAFPVEESSTDDDSIFLLPELPPVLKRKKIETVRTESPGEEVRSGDGESTNSHGMSQPPVGHGISSHGALTDNRVGDDSLKYVTVSMFNEFRVWQEVENANQKAENETILKNQEKIINLLSNGNLKAGVSEGFTVPLELPINSLLELETSGAYLGRDKMFQDFMVADFKGMKTKFIGDFVRKNLVKVLTNAVASQLNWAGKNGKVSFKKFSNIIRILKDAAQEVEGRFDEDLFKQHIANWLAQAPKRK